MKSLTHKLASLFLLFSLVGFSAIPANAWGPRGHRIVATIAQRHLTTKARQAISELLGDNFSLAVVANYADDVRDLRPETYNFHFVDIPKLKNNYVPGRDCKNTPKGDCVIAALERFKQQVVASNATPAERRFALKFIVHLVGDMHQPLHCADNHDRGGTLVSVKWFGEPSTLHKVWDSGIINKVGLWEEQYVSSLEQGLTPQQIDEMQTGAFIAWALESHTIARENSYNNIPASHKLAQAYFDKNKPVVDQQLLRGGLRLAKVLNDIFN